MVSRRLVHFLIASLLGILSALPVTAAGNVVHTTIPSNETFTFPLGPEARCFGVPEGTNITVHFIGEVKQTEFVSGPNVGRTHHVGKATITFTVPSTGARGTGRILFNDQAKDADTFRHILVVHINGTRGDGTAFKANFHVQMVVKNGEAKVDIYKVSCPNS